MVAQAFKVRTFFFLFLIALILPIFIGTASAQGQTSYQLRTASFTIPADWRLQDHWRDQEYDFISPDNQIKLWVRWWFPDEPLTGFPDILSTEKRTLAEQDALLIRTDSGAERSIQVAFLNKDEQGEQLLVQLFSATASIKTLEDQLFRILGHMTVNGHLAVPAEQSSHEGSDQYAGQDQPHPPVKGYHFNRAGDFSLSVPPQWQITDGEREEASFTFASSPQEDVAILVVKAVVGAELRSKAILDAYLGRLYRDSVLVKSIEGESHPELAGYTFHAIDVIANLYEIEGNPLPFRRGRVMIYQGGTDYSGFLILTFRPVTATNETVATLARITESLTIGQPVDTSGGMVAENDNGTENDGSDTDQQILIRPDEGKTFAIRPGSEWLPQVNNRLKSDCSLRSAEEWAHPTKEVLEEAGVDFRFVMQCNDLDHTVFGVSFRYDMRAKTDDFFHPLYFKMMKANNGRPFSFLDVRGAVFASLKRQENGNLALGLKDLDPMRRLDGLNPE